MVQAFVDRLQGLNCHHSALDSSRGKKQQLVDTLATPSAGIYSPPSVSAPTPLPRPFEADKRDACHACKSLEQALMCHISDGVSPPVTAALLETVAATLQTQSSFTGSTHASFTLDCNSFHPDGSCISDAPIHSSQAGASVASTSATSTSNCLSSRNCHLEHAVWQALGSSNASVAKSAMRLLPHLSEPLPRACPLKGHFSGASGALSPQYPSGSCSCHALHTSSQLAVFPREHPCSLWDLPSKMPPAYQQSAAVANRKIQFKAAEGFVTDSVAWLANHRGMLHSTEWNLPGLRRLRDRAAAEEALTEIRRCARYIAGDSFLQYVILNFV